MLLNEVEAKKRLQQAGVKVTDTRLATSRIEAIAISQQIGFPVVLKIVSPDIAHKSDAGGVKINLNNQTQVGEAYDAIITSVKLKVPDARILGVAVQEMVPAGLEIIIGMTKDPQFGPVLMFGLGGVWVEAIQDVAFRVVPISESDASAMLQEIKGVKLLQGFRGQLPVDMLALEEMLLKVSAFIQTNPQIKELDLNPVIAYPHGAIAVDARIITEDIAPAPAAASPRSGKFDLNFLFYPESVALAGASNNPNSRGYDFMQHLINFKYRGKIYPINNKSPEIIGLPAYGSLDAVPAQVDHVIYAIGLENLPAFLDSAARKGVKSIHIFSARGAETGRAEAIALETEIKRKAQKFGIRLLGPNCMGVYCPESGFSFCADFPQEAGDIGALIQSGGSSTDVTRYGALRGLKFSKMVSYGNALDINEMDLLRYLADDSKTRVIMAFIEGLRGDGRDFLDLVKYTTAKKPFIVCKGGLSKAGARTTMSHTASLAGSTVVWNTAIRQAGGIPVRDLDDLVNIAVAFSLIKPIKGRRIGTGGSGGGRNTVSADQWEDAGFEVVPLPRYIKEEFRRRGAALWDTLDNPADRSIIIPGDPYTVPALFNEMMKDPNYDFICANVAADDHPFNQQTFIDGISSATEDYLKLAKESPLPFFLIISDRPLGTDELDHWFWREVAHLRTRSIEEKVAYFPTVDKAAQAINELIYYYQRHAKIDDT